MRLVDPADAYLGVRSLRYRNPIYVGGAIFGPGVPGGSRQATQEELDAMRQSAGVRARVPHAPLADVSLVTAAAHKLNTIGEAQLVVADVTVSARLVTFWRGDAVLEIVCTGTQGESRTRLRVSPRASDERESTFCNYLTRQLHGFT